MKKIMILMLILILTLTACTQKQPMTDNNVVDNGAVNDADVVENVVEDTKYVIVDEAIEPKKDESMYSNNFEPNRQLLIGSYKIYESKGDLILEFSDYFEVGRNDNINVYLSTIGRPSEARHVWESKYEIVGDLVKPKGMQKYEIPSNINLINYKSIVLLDPTTGIVYGSARLTK